MNRKTAVILTVSVILIIAAVVCIVVFGKGSGDSQSESGSQSETETTAVPVTESESETEKEPEAVLSDWDRATLIWKGYDNPKIELRVRPGFDYGMKPDKDYCECVFEISEGKTVTVSIQFFDYKNSFESLLNFLSSKEPESLSVGERSKTIVCVYYNGEAEICSKINDDMCLTTVATDLETVKEFFSSVMIKVDGEDYISLDLSDIYNEI